MRCLVLVFFRRVVLGAPHKGRRRRNPRLPCLFGAVSIPPMPTLNPPHSLSTLLKGVQHHGAPLHDVEITSLAYDSRLVEPGGLFFALPGLHTDGRRYIPDAVNGGAKAVVTARSAGAGEAAASARTSVPVVEVENVRGAMSTISARFFDSPADKLFVVGVTGTDGKSTTVYFLWQLLRMLGVPAGFLSTPAVGVVDEVVKNPFRQSTPEAPEIHRFLARMVDAGCRVAVVEATSHGLSHKTARLADVHFDAGIFTNISHEHLEFHGSFENYRSDKGNLFRSVAGPTTKEDVRDDRFAVVNADDPQAIYMAGLANCDILRYGTTTSRLDLRYEVAEAGSITAFSLGDASTEGATLPGRLPFPGAFHVPNFVAALLAAARVVDRPPLDLIGYAQKLKTLRGRMTRIGSENPFSTFVDYAHTPGSFDVVLPELAKICNPGGRLIVVFGSAGERDVEKRPLQGEAAGRHADLVILTDEDPRGEDSMVIINGIAEGCRRYLDDDAVLAVPDRREAIATAIDRARPGDTLAFLGKAHESSIIYKDFVMDWDEIAVAQEELKKRGFDNELN